MTRSDPSKVIPDKAPGARMERWPNELVKIGDVTGRVTCVWIGEKFEVLTDAGDRVTFPVDAENEYDRCAGCGRIDPKTHRWYAARALSHDDAADPIKISFVLDSIKEQLAEHVDLYGVDGDVTVSGPNVRGNLVYFDGTVTPRLLCDKATP